MLGQISGTQSGTGLFPTKYALLNQSSSLSATVVFTAPTAGLYLFVGTAHIVSTNNLGTFTLTFSASPATLPIANTNPVLTSSPATDGYAATRGYYMTAGQTISVATTLAATVTTYNIYANFIRLGN
jgi:hypothetical protein